MDMRERIFSGELFLDNCQNLDKERLQAKRLMTQLNQLDPAKTIEKQLLLNEIFGQEVDVFVEAPFHFSYGTNIKLGSQSYINYNCNFIDDGKINIGSRVLIGANVTIATVGHPINPNLREFMYTEAVTIEDNCWIGAGVVINAGVTIGENSVIGSGSVVTKDIPKDSVAYGNPCRMMRKINEDDLNYYKANRKINLSELDDVRHTNQTT